MFQRSRKNLFQRAVRRAADPELGALYEELSQRQERVAQLELELFDTRANLAKFEREMDLRLGVLRERLERLQAELRQARRRAALRGQWGDRAGEADVPDVIEQFHRAWTPREAPDEKAAPPRVEVDENDLKTLFRSLAKRFHPDLVIDSEEKQWREGIMAQVNEAYRNRDLATLRKLAETPDRGGEAQLRTREQELVELRQEIRRLDGLIATLERTLKQLINSTGVRLMLDASIARREGRDLVGEMAADLKIQITEAEVELAGLR